MSSKSTTRTSTTKWKALRRRMIARWSRLNADGLIYCVVCGVATRTDGDPYHDDYLHVDHIRPYALNPELQFEPTNLQPMCRRDNLKKGKGAAPEPQTPSTSPHGFIDAEGRYNATTRSW